jgi:hypothetical protein
MTNPTPRTDWDTFNCDGLKCHCHEPFVCADCGCDHDETVGRATPDAGLRAALDQCEIDRGALAEENEALRAALAATEEPTHD